MSEAISNFPLADGYYDLANGKLGAIVTSLEMLAPEPCPQVMALPAIEVQLQRQSKPDVAFYRDIYRRIGEDWLWFSRLRLCDEELSDIIQHDLVNVFTVVAAGQAEGLLELDYRTSKTCEIALFGLTAGFIGRGVGRWMMGEAQRLAWSRDIDRLWIHTCTLDHPNALNFYRSSGFVPFKYQIEITDDPRLDGTLPETAASHVPLFKN